jgi:hypothetical protein
MVKRGKVRLEVKADMFLRIVGAYSPDHITASIAQNSRLCTPHAASNRTLCPKQVPVYL